jgi:DNA cross-link repair 1A protein
LVTGDFRWNTELMTKFPWLRAVSAGADGKFRVDTLYLDTTYCKPCYTFPTQRAAVDAVVELVLMHCGLDESANATNRLSFDTTSSPPPVSKTLFLFGTYSVGKEKIFMEVARALNEPVCVSAYKFRLISAFGWPPHIMVRQLSCDRCYAA